MKNLLPELIEPLQDDAHPFLDSIDPYGDTVFNRVQMKRFLHEWVDVITKAEGTEARTLVIQIQTLAERCQDDVHKYIKFIGD